MVRAVVIHAARDLRCDAVDIPALGPHDVRVRVECGGICGSDLHYYHDGGFGTVRLKEPMVLGHEAAGTVEAVGPAVTRVAPGDRIAINPSRPCRQCRYCQEGRQNHCLDMRFFGSAMRFPHVQGAFRQGLVIDQAQAVPIPSTMTMAEAATAEPLAVCLHAARRAGPLLGKRVLVTGCGPIGALAVLVASSNGAVEVVATDLNDFPLSVGAKMGATRTINLRREPDALAEYATDKGTFDLLIEASGSEAALRGALDALRPGAVIVQLGIGGTMTLPINVLVAKEFELRGSFRFHEEFEAGVALMARRALDVAPVLTTTIPFDRAVDAFELASDRASAMKVQLSFA